MSASGPSENDYFQKPDQDKMGDTSNSAMGASGALAAIMLNKSSHPSLSKLPPTGKEAPNVRRHLEPTTIPGLNSQQGATMDGATINIVTNNTGKMLGSVTQETLNPLDNLRK